MKGFLLFLCIQTVSFSDNLAFINHLMLEKKDCNRWRFKLLYTQVPPFQVHHE